MKFFGNKPVQKGNISRGDKAALLVSLLLASIIWFSVNLAREYSDVVEANISVSSNLEGHETSSSNTCEVLANCKMSGFNLLRNKLVSSRKTASIEIPRENLHQKDAHTYYTTSREIQQFYRSIFGDAAEVDYFITDTLVFKFQPVASKKVPVCLDSYVEFEPQYTQVGQVKVSPDSVFVYGDPSYIDKIEKVLTSRVRMTGVSSDIHGNARVRKLKNTRISEETVSYDIAVARYVEVSSKVVLSSRNVPPGKEFIVVPSSAEVVARCTFPISSDPLAKAVFYVDWNDYQTSRTGRCVVRCDGMPSSVIDWKVSPVTVDCVASDKVM